MYLHPQSCVFAVGPTTTSSPTQQQRQFATFTQPTTTAASTAVPGTTAAVSEAVNVSTPSSLTGFLAPGGQLPVHKDGTGDPVSVHKDEAGGQVSVQKDGTGGQVPVQRDGTSGQVPSSHKDGGGVVVTGKPSIVKVTLSPPGQQVQSQQQLQQPQQQPQHQRPLAAAEDTKYPKSGPNNHQQAYQLPPPTRSTDAFQSTPFKTSSASDWYYANYNKTNVEPFVSKTSSTASRAGHPPTVSATAAIALTAVSGFGRSPATLVIPYCTLTYILYYHYYHSYYYY